MRFNLIAGVLGAFLTFLGLIMLTPAVFSLAFGETETLPGILLAAAATMGTGLLLWASFRVGKKEITTREGLIIVAGAWILACLFGALPYLFCGVFPRFTDCYFECTSGFTTTGATVLTKIEGLPRSLLFWRALTHWLGGMGIIVLSVAILPLIGVGGMSLFRAEVPGPVADKIKPRIAETARTLWIIYIILSLVEWILLMVGGMDLHEALCHTFATMATGGFSTRNLSIESFHSPFLEWVITVFMFTAGVNFALHFAVLRSGFKGYWRNTEFRVYLVVVLVSVLLATVVLRLEVYGTLGESVRYGAFQVNTILSTTGFTTADYEVWPSGLQMLLLILMFVGGCTGSTGGGIKVMRIWLMAKHAYNELYLLVHPRAVRPLTYGTSTVSPQVMRSIWSFFFIFMVVFFAGSLVLTLLELHPDYERMDPLSAMSAVVACLGNVGPALGSVGPHDNYAHVPLLGKWVLILCMLLGRLEIYTIIILFVPEFWRK